MYRYSRTLWLLSGLALSLAPLSGCTPEGDELVPMKPLTSDPCVDTDANLSDGIQDGSELREIFECVNRNGDLDPLVPVIDAMETATISDGETTVLNMWLDIINQEIEKVQGSDATVNTGDLVDMLEQLIALLSEDALPQMVALVGDVLESGTVEPLVPVLGTISEQLLLQRTDGTYEAFFEQLEQLLCPDLESRGQCIGDMQQLYKGLMQAELSYGSASYPLPSGEAIAYLLADLFAYHQYKDYSSIELNRSLARGLKRLSDGIFLERTLGTYVPDLYGDNPDTPETIEGYESYNANQSALYGLMALMGSDGYLDEMKLELDYLAPLLQNYYVYNPFNLYGAVGRPPEGTCDASDGETAFERENPAYYGVDQILRVLKAADVEYTDLPACQLALEEILYYAGGYYELSGSKNIATVLLEASAQLSVEDVQLSTDVASAVPGLVGTINELCGTSILEDDFEALQASVKIDAVIAPTLKLLAAINHAAQPGSNGIGGMETVKDLLIDLYDTHVLCEIQPWLAAAVYKDGPLSHAVYYLEPFVPGQPYHEPVIVPALRLLNSLRGAPASTLVPPIAAALGAPGMDEDLAEVLEGIGRLGKNAVENDSERPALYDLDKILAALAAYDPEAQAIEGMVRVIDERTILNGVLETIAVPEVRAALNDDDEEVTAIGFVAETVDSGELLNLLYLVRGLLVQVDTSIKASQDGDSSG